MRLTNCIKLPANVYGVKALPKLSHSGYSFFQVFIV
jgi:hypothetical protein